MTLTVAAPRERTVSERTARVAEFVQTAHQRTIAATCAEMATYLRELFGQKLTAVITGVDDPKTVGKWTRGQMPHPDQKRRLRDAFQIATLLELASSPQTVQAWFMGMHPDLEDQAPALVIADDPNGGYRVMRAAHAFLAHG